MITWAQDEEGNPISSRGSRWDSAERGIIVGLADIGMPDVYRKVHGYQSMPSSWVLKRGGARIGRRFDHVFAAQQLNPTSVDYRDAWRENNLSDHAAIEVSFDTQRLDPI